MLSVCKFILLQQNTLTSSQDKAFRRISELKEQIQLDQMGKQHLEENYRLMLEEKDELIKVLQTQVSLVPAVVFDATKQNSHSFFKIQ